ncbi:MAG: hypothetical protein ACE144_10110 [Thermodesulfobacteriota bacterium]
MKIIISHDVDHYTALEHVGDLIVPKSLIRNSLELILRRVSIREYFSRWETLIKNQWNNVQKIISFDKEHEIPSTFFVAANKGLGLSYNLRTTKALLDQISSAGFNVGIHGIAFEDFDSINCEYHTFKRIFAMEPAGIRMHCLRMNKQTACFLNDVGFKYDSSIHLLEDPFKIGNLWEFPVHIMDTDVFCGRARWQVFGIEEAMKRSQRILEDLEGRGIRYSTILFHDFYFYEGYKSWKEWYIRFVEYIRLRNYSFVNFESAIDELENRTA